MLAKCDDSQLCLELELDGQPREVAFHKVYRGDPPSRVIRASRNFALIADIAPLVEGHVLLVPREHFLSIGHLPVDLQTEFDEFRAECIALVAKHYRTPTVLEHGSTLGSVSSCISHAHWHLIPGVGGILELIAADGLESMEIASWRALRTISDSCRPYIYVFQSSRQMVYTDVSSIPRQYLRMKSAEILGIPDPEWDWGLSLHPELLRSTVKVLK